MTYLCFIYCKLYHARTKTKETVFSIEKLSKLQYLYSTQGISITANTELVYLSNNVNNTNLNLECTEAPSNKGTRPCIDIIWNIMVRIVECTVSKRSI